MLANSARETEAIAKLVECGFTLDNGKAVLRGEDAIMRFFSAATSKTSPKVAGEGRRALSACHS